MMPRSGRRRAASSTSAVLQSVEIRTNEWGLRGGPVPPPQSGQRRILVLGSSVTLGWGVAEDETMVGRLQKMFEKDSQDVVVMNAELLQGHIFGDGVILAVAAPLQELVRRLPIVLGVGDIGISCVVERVVDADGQLFNRRLRVGIRPVEAEARADERAAAEGADLLRAK